MSRPKYKPEKAFDCLHTDQPNYRIGRCKYCYSLFRRPNLTRAQIAARIAKHDRRQLIKAMGVSWYGADFARAYRYGISPAKLKASLEEQQHACAACKQPFNYGRRKMPHIDHDHDCCAKAPTCGKCTRGILCGRCNIVLGLLEEDIRLLPPYLLDYLKKFAIIKGQNVEM